MAKKSEHGWAPDVGSGGSEAATEANRKAFEGPPPDKGSGREESEEHPRLLHDRGDRQQRAAACDAQPRHAIVFVARHQ